MVWAIVPAAGVGSRFKTTNSYKETSKLLVKLASGLTVLEQCILSLDNVEVFDGICLGVKEGEIEQAKSLLSHLNLKSKLKFEIGGDTRQQTVFNCLKTLGSPPIVAVHDAARPIVRADEVRQLMGALQGQTCGAIIAGPVTSTLKKISGSQVVSTLDRSQYCLAHTPQFFKFKHLLNAHTKADFDNFLGTDDASIVEKYGGMVKVVLTDKPNIKITYQSDINLVNEIYRSEAAK